ncbi:cation transport protein-domain-containing protein [Coniella lustricola]|uniref:Potassium transport protein n=1 Tax=Coniella lustricola TaxID=2025994 RepID=A0A2T2ZTJ9_9PEZI|nr:cation transport protein-domain-containing protein [Coniella lustricola]
MVSPVYSIFWDQLKSLKPSFVSKKPHFNFITAHYFWVVGLTIVASILIYASEAGSIAYIDALFFAAGANTQAGLNPVDVNKLNTFQQIVIMICSITSNPIAINSFVVFLRLFWFEKKFQDLVREARNRRATISKSKAKANTGVDPVSGVNGRNIRVMHDGTRVRITNDGFVIDGPFQQPATANGAPSSAAVDDDPSLGDDRTPGITFAGTVKRSDGVEDAAVKMPDRSNEEHIAILQRQRNTDNEEVLRIPGPRDVELGERPTRVENEAADEEPDPLSAQPNEYNDDARTSARPKGITIQEPTKKPSRREEFNDDAIAFLRVFTPFKIRKPRVMNSSGEKLHQHSTGGSFARVRRNTVGTIRDALSSSKYDLAPYLSWQPTLGRNSAFVGELTDEQREELGGIEYRSLKTLSLILTLYFWGFWALSVVLLTPWIMHSSYGSVVTGDGQGRPWWGIFTASSAFTDLGFTLTPDSMNSFNTAVYPLLVMSFFIVIGNTGFPVMLRFIIWVSSILAPRHSGLWEELRFLLDHPRRCFTLLFPSAATWWLFWLLVILNGLDLIFFVILDLGSGVVADLPAGIKVLDGAFQAFSTRTAGFSCVNLAELHPGVQTSYLIMMYISIFPIAISVRRTNVYEEKSLGIYQGVEDSDEAEPAGSLSYVGAHLRRQLSFDLWYIFIGFFILSITEGTRIQNNDFSMFAILFEIVSAYGTVGLSLGYSGVNASLSSQFSVIGKLVIIAMQIRGRHRGLPYGLDRAVLLPSETRFRHEAVDPGLISKARTLPRRNSMASVATDGSRVRHGRSRSISDNNRIDRVNSNLLTSLLHPGPALPPHAPRKGMMEEGDEDDTERGGGGRGWGMGLDGTSRNIPKLSETFSLSRRSEYNTRGREDV